MFHGIRSSISNAANFVTSVLHSQATLRELSVRNNSTQQIQPEQTYVPSTQPKWASMPQKKPKAIGNLNFVETPGKPVTNFVNRYDPDPIEDDDDPLETGAHRMRSIETKLRSISPSTAKPRTSGANGIIRLQSSKVDSNAASLLGDTRSKRERDAVTIELPGSEMMKKYKDNSFRPVNTLDGPAKAPARTSSKDNLRHYRSPGHVSTSRAPDHHYSERENPSKKPRLDDMANPRKPVKTKRSSGSWLSTDDRDELALSSEANVTPNENNTGTFSNSKQSILGNRRSTDNVKRNKNSRIHQQILIPSKFIGRVARAQQTAIDSGSDEEHTNFTKDSRLERKGGDLMSPESPMEDITTLDIRSSATKRTSNKGNPRSTPPELIEIFTPTRDMPGTLLIDEDSPDELQVEESTVSRGNIGTRHQLQLKTGNLADETRFGPGKRRATDTLSNKAKKSLPISKDQSSLEEFKLTALRYDDLIDWKGYKLVLNKSKKEFEIGIQEEYQGSKSAPLSTDPIKGPYSLDIIRQVEHGGDDNCKLLFFTSKSKPDDNKFYLTMSSHRDMIILIGQLQELIGDLRVNVKDSGWIDRKFARSASSNTSESNVVRPALPASEKTPRNVQNEVTSPYFISSGRQDTTIPRQPFKPADSIYTSRPLGDAGAKSRTVITGSDRRSSLLYGLAESARAQENPKHEENSTGKTLRPLAEFFPTRSTRSTTSKKTTDSNNYDRNEVTKVKFSHTGGLGERWKVPLMYPKTGKKRETVNYDDLPRLDIDEFLNDSLVGFFLRYLEHHLEQQKPELWKRIYFFNSYFHERLNKDQKQKKFINYEAVEKWTRSVDLFSRDFVIVPVNENLHWFVAIICNLTYFKDEKLRKKAMDNEGEEDEAEAEASTTTLLDDPVPVEEFLDDEVGLQVSSDLLEDDEKARTSFAGLQISDGEKGSEEFNNEPQSSPPEKSATQSKKGRRKSVSKSLRKYNPALPVIITLDSLGNARSATCSALRQYIVLEAKKKRGWDIEGSSISGMTAKNIPSQNNFSDCGLFLCAYLEKLVLDPRGFVHKILQREHIDWPFMKSEVLRERFRDMVMELHREQEGEIRSELVPAVGSILLHENIATTTVVADAPRKDDESYPKMLTEKTRVQKLIDDNEKPAQPTLPMVTVEISVTNRFAEPKSPTEISDLNVTDSHVKFPRVKKVNQTWRPSLDNPISTTQNLPSSPQVISPDSSEPKITNIGQAKRLLNTIAPLSAAAKLGAIVIEDDDQNVSRPSVRKDLEAEDQSRSSEKRKVLRDPKSLARQLKELRSPDRTARENDPKRQQPEQLPQQQRHYQRPRRRSADTLIIEEMEKYHEIPDSQEELDEMNKGSRRHRGNKEVVDVMFLDRN